jgi:hypothetical protein
LRGANFSDADLSAVRLVSQPPQAKFTGAKLHDARAGTIDRSAEVFGQSPYHHRLPAHRGNSASPI